MVLTAMEGMKRTFLWFGFRKPDALGVSGKEKNFGISPSAFFEYHFFEKKEYGRR